MGILHTGIIMEYGWLTLIKEDGSDVYGQKRKQTQRMWICQCRCGKSIRVAARKVKCGSTISCGCSRLRNLNHKRGPEHNSWSGHEGITGSFWARVQASAKQREIEFNISKEYMWDMIKAQGFKCSLSGVDIQLAFSSKDLHNGFNTASIDRIDSSKGYIEGNVQWVHVKINYMKQSISQEEFIQFCKLVALNKETP